MIEKWLNGHDRKGATVLIGTGTHCAGCGRFCGTTCVFIPDNYIPPPSLPAWPFEQDTCPVCNDGGIRCPLEAEEIAERCDKLAIQQALLIKRKNLQKPD